MWPLFIFIVLLLGWSALLWLALPIAIIDRSIAAIALLHIAPPVLPMIAWSLVDHSRRSVLQRRDDLRIRDAQNQREIEREIQWKEHHQQLAKRRAYIEVRWSGIGDGYLRPDDPHVIESPSHTITLSSTNSTCRNEDRWPERPLSRLLESLFSQCPLAMTLPIVLSRPSNPVLSDVVPRTFAARQAALLRLSVTASPTVEVVTLDSDGALAHGELAELFANHPDWPGALLVAFDFCGDCDPISTRLWQEDLDNEKVIDPQQKWYGAPNGGVAVLLLTPPTLSAALSQIYSEDGSNTDNLTPFWERNYTQPGIPQLLAQLPPATRSNIPPPQVMLHGIRQIPLQSSFAAINNISALQELIQEAAVDAELIEPPFVFDGKAEPSDQSPKLPINSCAWLVHNCGDITCGGERLAQLSLALYRHSIEIHPTESATNMITTFGHCGSASSWLQLAHGVQRVSTLRKPVFFSRFQGDIFSASFLMPVTR